MHDGYVFESRFSAGIIFGILNNEWSMNVINGLFKFSESVASLIIQ